MFVPLKPVRNSNIKSRRWYPAALRHAINKKRCLWCRKRSDLTNTLLSTAYHTAELKFRNLLRDYEIKREQKIIERNNVCCFYRFVNNKLSCKRGLGALGNGKGGVIVIARRRTSWSTQWLLQLCLHDRQRCYAHSRALSTYRRWHRVGRVHAWNSSCYHKESQSWRRQRSWWLPAIAL